MSPKIYPDKNDLEKKNLFLIWQFVHRYCTKTKNISFSLLLLDIVSTNKWSQCQICKLVITSVNLWRHMRTQHTNQEPKRCDRCNKQFKNKYSLREHVRMAHENKQHVQPAPGSTTPPPTGGGAVTGPSTTMPSTEQTNIESDHFEALVEKKSLKLY